MSILVVASHPDDEALGCGGAMRRHADSGDEVGVLFLCDGVSARAPEQRSRAAAARREAACIAAEILGASEPRFLDFPDNRLDTVPLLDVVQAIETILAEVRPTVVYTHHSGDLNIDHRRTARAVMTACRPQGELMVRSIYGFEVPSSTEWAPPRAEEAFLPQHFVDIAGRLEAKLAALAAYGDEMRPFPHPRSGQAVTALAKWRGASAGLEAAEAFIVLRQIKTEL